MDSSSTPEQKSVANVAVIGLGWWAQGWHLPHLHRNPRANLVGIVDRSPHPKSNLNPNLESLDALSKKYSVPAYSSLQALLQNTPDLDGIIVSTPHSTHSQLGEEIYSVGRPIHILMEKPMTTNLQQARRLHELATSHDSTFLINHSANYVAQTKSARENVGIFMTSLRSSSYRFICTVNIS